MSWEWSREWPFQHWAPGATTAALWLQEAKESQPEGKHGCGDLALTLSTISGCVWKSFHSWVSQFLSVSGNSTYFVWYWEKCYAYKIPTQCHADKDPGYKSAFSEGQGGKVGRREREAAAFLNPGACVQQGTIAIQSTELPAIPSSLLS